MSPRFDPKSLSIYLVTDSDQCFSAGRTVLDTVVQAVDNGVTCVQLREKSTEASDFLHLVLAVSEAVGHRIPIIVNDRVDVYLVAKLLGANVAGVHLGQTDLPVPQVRQLVGDKAIIGLSAATLNEIKAAEKDTSQVDYIGIGVVHNTATKTDAPSELGILGCTERARSTKLPSVAIGGIKLVDIPRLAESDLDGVAVVSAICLAADVKKATRELAEAWHNTKSRKLGES